MPKPQNTIIFTDGACSGNPGPGGWGAIVATPSGNVQELGGAAAQTTNNKMELLATIEAIRSLEKCDDLGTKILIHTDSTYVIRGITAWIFGWMRNGWKNSQGNDVENVDLWQALLDCTKKYKGKIEWRYVRGHQGIPGNERCDAIAVGFSKGPKEELYAGSVEHYGINLEDLPEDMSLPAPQDFSKNKSTKAVTYLSYVNGKLHKDADWKSCEARVKGVAGAKFKKVSSSAEEAEILKKWGI